MNVIKVTPAQKPGETKFYHFRQNNSGGSVVIDDDVAINVIIEANSAEQANRSAQAIGIYFDGCDSGKDCSCCGDRWYKADESDGTAAPSIYNTHPEEYECKRTKPGQPVCHLYRIDGTKVTYSKPEAA